MTLIATITDEAFEMLNNDGYVTVMDFPSGCSNQEPSDQIVEILEGNIPDCEITETMILNGQKMLVFVHHLSDNGQESACCSWSQVAFEKVG